MILETLNKEQLLAYVTSEEYRVSEHIAISKHRAISHIHNPRVHKEDILLIRAMVEGEMAGYLGILPDDIVLDGRESIHCGWMSCLWVNPSYRGQKIAQKLVKKCFECWNDQVILTEFTEAAGQLYYKSQLFGTPVIKHGFRWYFRFPLSVVLPPKKHFFHRIKKLLRFTDSMANLCLSPFVRLGKDYHFTYKVTLHEHITEEIKHYIRQHNTGELFRRGSDELEWTIQFPWITSDDLALRESFRYAFSSWSESFIHQILSIRDKTTGKIEALILFTIRDGHLRLPYIYFGEDKKALEEGISYIFHQYSVSMMTCYHPEISHLKMPGILLLKKNQTRTYLFSVKLLLKIHPKTYQMHDGDGDCSFT